MSLKNLYIYFTVFIALLMSCAPVAYRPAPYIQSPMVRVGLMEHADSLTISSDRPIHVYSKAGNRIVLPAGKRFTITRTEEGEQKTKYRIQYAEFPDSESAEQTRRKLMRYGIKSQLERKGGELRLGHKKIAGRTSYVLYDTKSWHHKEEAEQHLDRLGAKKAQIIALPYNDGRLVLYSGSKKLNLGGTIKCQGGPITIYNVPVGHGYHWTRKETRTYKGQIEIRLNEQGKLTVINVLPLSDYLEGVLPGEMPVSFPMEALKAQAIAARTYFLHNYGKSHYTKPFDVCDDVHCQSYVGISENDKVRRAVRQTRGQVLMAGDQLCNTPYCAMCGGHTENAEHVWNGEGVSYLRGLFDVEHPKALEHAMDLSQEQDIERWLEADPNVFCNIARAGDPEFAQYAKKFFRWSVTFTREELEQHIKQYTGTNFGTLIDLIPLSRGVSGRLIELEVIGTRRTFTIGKELRIRKALSPETLYSACIIINPIGRVGELYESFEIKGGGWGHGVGMCQIGAACMAHRGKTAELILEHYYMGAKVVMMY